MRFDEVRARCDENLAAYWQLVDVGAPPDAIAANEAERAALIEHRDYDVGGLTVHTTTDPLAFRDGHSVVWFVQTGRFTAARLRLAAEIAAHVEAWLAGEIDELAPSGPWPPA